MHWRHNIDTQIDILKLLILEQLFAKPFAVDFCGIRAIVIASHGYVLLKKRHAYNVGFNIGARDNQGILRLDYRLSFDVNILRAELAIAKHVVSVIESACETRHVKQVELDAYAVNGLEELVVPLELHFVDLLTRSRRFRTLLRVNLD